MHTEFRACATRVLALAAPRALALACFALPLAAQDTQPLRYVRAPANGARFFNLADTKAEVVARAAAGTPIAVYGESAGYLEAEPASGIEAWVFGSFVRPTEQGGLAEITGNNVLMRPLPSSGERSFPLSQRLDQGDRVRVVGRNDPAKPLAQDWVRIVAPAGTRAWVAQTETEPLEAGADARALWAAASRDALAARPAYALQADPKAATAPKAGEPGAPKAGEVAPGTAGAAGAAGGAATTLAEADALLAAQRAAPNPDFGPARAAYQQILTANPKGPLADTARMRLDEIATREEILKIKADAVLAEQRRIEELGKANERLRVSSLSTDPLWGRFQARGWLVRQGERWIVRWADQNLADVVCTSGRYDLSAFEGFEIGVTGRTMRAAVPASAGGAAQPSKLDATRIEVISARPKR